MEAIFEQIEYWATWLQVLLSGGCAAVAMWRASRRRGLWIYQLMGGAFACDSLAALFWNLYISIYHQHPWYFSAADLSWMGIYAFLIATSMGLAGDHRAALRGLRLRAALIAAAIAVPPHVFMICAAGQLFSNICYGIAIFSLLYHAILSYIGARKGVLRPAFRAYHRAIVLYMMFTLAMLVFSCFTGWLYCVCYVADWVVILMPPYILGMFRKGVRGQC